MSERDSRLDLDATQVDPASPLRRQSGQAAPAAPPTDRLSLGDALQELRSLGEYRILRRLADGGMGSVYLAFHPGQGREVALKVLPDTLASNQGYVDRFYREARSGALLNHPNIVRSLAVGQDRATGKHYLVMEYVDGPSAHDLLGRFGKLAVPDAVHIALDVARALEHAQSRSVVHRDIKPGNILLTKAGVAKLADLGLAKRTDEASHLTGARQGFGTSYYMPYEQAINAKNADGRSDIYALGATLYHLLTGEVPFPGDNHLDVVEKKQRGDFTPAGLANPEVPLALDRVLDRMMACHPRDRYQTASELIVDLERSGLAAPVPSFVDQEVALKDPTVRARLTAAGEPTRPDLDASHGTNGEQRPPAGPKKPGGKARQGSARWHLRYRDGDGRSREARVTARQIVRWLADGRIPPDAEACRRPADGYRPVASYPELRPAGRKAPEEKPEDEPKPRRRWLLVAGVVSGVGALAAGLLWLLRLLANGA